jgi:hypothetical protein
MTNEVSTLVFHTAELKRPIITCSSTASALMADTNSTSIPSLVVASWDLARTEVILLQPGLTGQYVMTPTKIMIAGQEVEVFSFKSQSYLFSNENVRLHAQASTVKGNYTLSWDSSGVTNELVVDTNSPCGNGFALYFVPANIAKLYPKRFVEGTVQFISKSAAPVDDTDLSGGAIAGIVIGSLIFILLLSFVIYKKAFNKNPNLDRIIEDTYKSPWDHFVYN